MLMSWKVLFCLLLLACSMVHSTRTTSDKDTSKKKSNKKSSSSDSAIMPSINRGGGLSLPPANTNTDVGSVDTNDVLPGNHANEKRVLPSIGKETSEKSAPDLKVSDEPNISAKRRPRGQSFDHVSSVAAAAPKRLPALSSETNMKSGRSKSTGHTRPLKTGSEQIVATDAAGHRRSRSSDLAKAIRDVDTSPERKPRPLVSRSASQSDSKDDIVAQKVLAPIRKSVHIPVTRRGGLDESGHTISEAISFPKTHKSSERYAELATRFLLSRSELSFLDCVFFSEERRQCLSDCYHETSRRIREQKKVFYDELIWKKRFAEVSAKHVEQFDFQIDNGKQGATPTRVYIAGTPSHITTLPDVYASFSGTIVLHPNLFVIERAEVLWNIIDLLLSDESLGVWNIAVEHPEHVRVNSIVFSFRGENNRIIAEEICSKLIPFQKYFAKYLPGFQYLNLQCSVYFTSEFGHIHGSRSLCDSVDKFRDRGENALQFVQSWVSNGHPTMSYWNSNGRPTGIGDFSPGIPRDQGPIPLSLVKEEMELHTSILSVSDLAFIHCNYIHYSNCRDYCYTEVANIQIGPPYELNSWKKHGISSSTAIAKTFNSKVIRFGAEILFDLSSFDENVESVIFSIKPELQRVFVEKNGESSASFRASYILRPSATPIEKSIVVWSILSSISKGDELHCISHIYIDTPSNHVVESIVIYFSVPDTQWANPVYEILAAIGKKHSDFLLDDNFPFNYRTAGEFVSMSPYDPRQPHYNENLCSAIETSINQDKGPTHFLRNWIEAKNPTSLSWEALHLFTMQFTSEFSQVGKPLTMIREVSDESSFADDASFYSGNSLKGLSKLSSKSSLKGLSRDSSKSDVYSSDFTGESPVSPVSSMTDESEDVGGTGGFSSAYSSVEDFLKTAGDSGEAQSKRALATVAEEDSISSFNSRMSKFEIEDPTTEKKESGAKQSDLKALKNRIRRKSDHSK